MSTMVVAEPTALNRPQRLFSTLRASADSGSPAVAIGMKNGLPERRQLFIFPSIKNFRECSM
jgi:hypothetical protein